MMKFPFFTNKAPRRIVIIIVGAAVGLIFGVVGVVIGIVLAYFLGELLTQIHSDKTVRDYFENPGSSAFYEGESGLAAFCGLSAYLLARSRPQPLGDEAAAARIAGSASQVFPSGKKITALAESFARIAQSRVKSLNPDLLTESLAARRSSSGDLPLIAAELSYMASGRDAEQLARYIRQILDPSYQGETKPISLEDPWKVLDVPRGASKEEIKSAFRKLALIYHPDNQAGMTADERDKMGQAFMTICEAYRELMRGE
jgi:DnaJ like chaperone protein